MTNYALSAALLAVLGLGAALWVQNGRVGRLTDDLAAVRVSLAACAARATDRDEHKDRSDEINNLPDDGLRERASEWMLP